MTEEQITRVQNKIKNYKKILAADRKLCGGYYDDSRGIRYLPPEQFIKIQDYFGGLRYLRWFKKNFPDDSGYPIFLFEWAFILFKCNKFQEAEMKAHETYFSNTYLFDKFLEKEFLQHDKEENVCWERESITNILSYNYKDTEFLEFSDWLLKVLNSRFFLDKANEFIEIEQQLKNEPVGKKRSALVNRISKIKYGK